MDLEGEDLMQGAISGGDNTCKIGFDGSKKSEEDNLGDFTVEGMDIDHTSETNNSAGLKGELGEVIEREAGIEEYCSKADVSSSRGYASIINQDPMHESTLRRPLSRHRRSEAPRFRLRTVIGSKTRSGLLSSQRSSAKLGLLSAAPQNPKVDQDKGGGKRSEDGDELRQSSSSEELNDDEYGNEEEADAVCYKCEICNEEFGSAKRLNFHKRNHPQYTLRRNPKRSRKMIDQEIKVGGEGTAPVVQGLEILKTSSVTEDLPKPCTECGKEFSSWKALFGHMRCHPEREWRGIQPPAEETNARKTDGGGNHFNSRRRRRRAAPVNQLHPPPPVAREDSVEKSASVDSKRATQEASKASDNESDTESIEAAYMSNGDRDMGYGTTWSKRSKRSRQTHCFLEAASNAKVRFSSSQDNAASESNDMAETLMMLQVQANLQANHSRERNILASTPESHGSKSRTSESGVEGETDEVDLRDVKDEAASLCGHSEEGADLFDSEVQDSSGRSKYECATCKRQFKSHQALGGHRASHKKVKGCFARTNPSDGGAHDHSTETSTDADDDMEFHAKSEIQFSQELPENSHTSTDEDRPLSHLTPARADIEEMQITAHKSKSHVCSICHRVFNSGQALGGHKRCHWSGGSGAGEVTSAKPVKSQELEGEPQCRPVKEAVLDLNLPAPEFLEEEMAQQQDAGVVPLNYLPTPSLNFYAVYA